MLSRQRGEHPMANDRRTDRELEADTLKRWADMSENEIENDAQVLVDEDR
ncbi:hypothetical protein GCM10023321_14320 [Pseudonocardia eucalypti]|uniref:Uncharacterized protein n=1 Tax=Pseudonocardia eucalypti TaxID=648755 RepID=A0ABP9PVR4_9PSEU